MSEAVGKFERETGRFNPQKSFFVLDSNHLDNAETKLYGYTFVNDKIVDNAEALNGSSPEKEGAWVYLLREGNCLTIRQDYLGCYGLYYYQKEEYFAVSNSFLVLTDYLRTFRKLTLNREYADYLLSADMCSSVYGETLVREISVLDRSAELSIDIEQRTLQIRYRDYCENTVDPDSPEGFEIIDTWRNKWVRRIRRMTAETSNIRTDLSGGFDSRVTLALFLSSGVDMSRVMINSKNDRQKTHEEDYRIASAIAEHYGFILNHDPGLSGGSEPFSLKEMLDINLYTKLGFHKQMYYSHNRQNERRYSFTGFGGGCIRELWNENEGETIEKAVQRCHMFQGLDSDKTEQMKRSVRNIMQRSFDNLRKKYELFGRDFPEQYLSQSVYRDTRGRVHFGKSMVVQFFSNVITLCPLTDPDLYKLKLSSERCRDNNLLYSLIMERYTPGILSFGFDSGRSISPDTLEYARERNCANPFREGEVLPVHAGEPVSERKNKSDRPLVPSGLPDETVRKAFFTPDVREVFESEYGPQMYSAVSADIAARTYYPMSVGYAAVAIVRILQDTRIYDELNTPFPDYLEQLAEKHSEEQRNEELSGPGQSQPASPGILSRAARKILRTYRKTADRFRR